VALAAGNGVYVSTNAGLAWRTNSIPIDNWISVCSSADGNKLIAVSNNGLAYTWQSTPSPSLKLTRWGANLTFSWLVPSTSFVLQQSADLTSWMFVTNTPLLNLTNLHNQVTLTPSNSSGFYRLTTP